MQTKATRLIGTLAVLCMLGAAPLAGAAVLGADSADSVGTPAVLYSQSSLVKGSVANVTTLYTPGPGELFLTLTDLDYTNTFGSLKFSLSNSTTALVGLAEPGILTLDLTQPTTLYADVFATAGGRSELGIYNLTATFLGASPVPLPASVLMLGCGLLALWLFGLKGWRVSDFLVGRGQVKDMRLNEEGARG